MITAKQLVLLMVGDSPEGHRIFSFSPVEPTHPGMVRSVTFAFNLMGPEGMSTEEVIWRHMEKFVYWVNPTQTTELVSENFTLTQRCDFKTPDVRRSFTEELRRRMREHTEMQYGHDIDLFPIHELEDKIIYCCLMGEGIIAQKGSTIIEGSEVDLALFERILITSLAEKLAKQNDVDTSTALLEINQKLIDRKESKQS